MGPMGGKPQILVVDDDLTLCGVLHSFLVGRGYDAFSVASADDALRRFRADRPDAVVLDIVIPGNMDGLGALAAFKKIDRDVPVIVTSGQGPTSTVVQAMKLGAADYVCKPFEDHELEMLLVSALKQRQLAREVETLREQLKHSRYTMLFGTTDSMTEVCNLIERVSDTDVTVLIRGESGTGKEFVARAVHDRSLRRDRPMVKANCAALPTELLESELFGFERGAFTGAIQQKPGKFEFANHGTMFLDEIGDMRGPLQAKLLQVLQDGEFSRLGGKHHVQVDVRVITATNRDLETAVAEGTFREDLYFRLNVVTISLSPLRERREEIPFLADHFLKRHAVQYNKPVNGISGELSREFIQYEWPGNIRQLENMIKRMVVLGSEAPILAELRQASSSPVAKVFHAPRTATVSPVAPATVVNLVPADVSGITTGSAPAVPGSVSLKEIARAAAREAERALILQMLTRTRWNRKEAAEHLGISYKALLYKIKENGLDEAS